ncbi:hypothetical protein [Bertelyvirus sp.]|nr:hypothetical protein CcrC2_gp445 [Caulobacter phage C2]WGN97339.1 hypothetical protein [Bertelyvirus sp.]
MTLDDAVQRLPTLMLLASGGGRWTRLRDTSIDVPLLNALLANDIVILEHYKKPQIVRGKQRFFYMLGLTQAGDRLAAAISDAFRHGNLAWAAEGHDGVGRHAMRQEWGLPSTSYVSGLYHRRKVLTPSPCKRRDEMKAAARS